jgi:hypothetical protein
MISLSVSIGWRPFLRTGLHILPQFAEFLPFIRHEKIIA